MPLLKSAIKKKRRDDQRTILNRNKRRQLHDAIKAVEKSVAKKEDSAKISAALNLAYKKIDKAVKKNLLHKNTGARRKSRVAKLAKQAAKK